MANRHLKIHVCVQNSVSLCSCETCSANYFKGSKKNLKFILFLETVKFKYFHAMLQNQTQYVPLFIDNHMEFHVQVQQNFHYFHYSPNS